MTKRIFTYALALVLITLSQTACRSKPKIVYYKPVIYLYPQSKMAVDVRLSLNGAFILTEPVYENGWSVVAEPDGRITNKKDGKIYPYLFWEADMNTEFQINDGFVVEGKNSSAFLDSVLTIQGLNANETKEFKEFWVPRLEKNKFNCIRFAQEDYTNNAQLEITPKPNTITRIFMIYRAAESKINLPKQTLKTPVARSGFTVIEWGGASLDDEKSNL